MIFMTYRGTRVESGPQAQFFLQLLKVLIWNDPKLNMLFFLKISDLFPQGIVAIFNWTYIHVYLGNYLSIGQTNFFMQILKFNLI